ncbi:CATRA conflict system CASPASE/TPR repeat-associated protein [Nonomuraea sp. NPDC049646]|uniref:CATRA conflict system CASPASE/TPR repeat-associated protein n=1 Tax=unclassified Nonomuraea TaxID=2593643 RepID=UPI003793975A
MKSPALTDQELIVHVFAPVEGPFAAEGYEQVREIWSRCRRRLGTTLPVAGTGLLTTLPRTLRPNAPDRALAAQEDPRADCQIIARQIHDVLNLSLVFASPLDAADRAARLGSRTSNGWVEFDRWWEELSGGGTGALLGSARIYQAKHQEQPISALGDAVRLGLPAAEWRPDWDEQRHERDGFLLWETGAGGDDRAERRLVILASPDRDAELSAWTWSRGDVSLPPLARHLMHAAKVRYQLRIWGDGEQTSSLERETDARISRIQRLLRDRPASPELLLELRELRVSMADLATTGAQLDKMRHTVTIALDNMTKSPGEPLPGDLELAEWFIRELQDAGRYARLTLSNARSIEEIARSEPPRQAEPPPGRPVRSRDPGERELVRMGFAVDVVEYSARSGPGKRDVQDRMAALCQQVLDDLGVDVTTTDRQDTGDGMNVFLPQDLELHDTLPRLLHAWRDRLAADNRRFSDRMRLRLAVVLGPFGIAAIGYSGPTIIEVNRMLNSESLREVVRDNPESDVVAVIADVLYRYVVREGYLNPENFRRCRVESKEYAADAWSWVGR